MSEKSNKLTIFLIKTEFADFSTVVKEGLTPTEINGVGSFYSKPSNPRTPDWAREFFGVDFVATGLKVSSASGLLLVRMERENVSRIFALTFGTGRFLLNDVAIEERFGLKVVLNTVQGNSLRSIDKTSLGHTSKHSREQISHAGEASAFGIDIEQDLVNAATGKSTEEAFGKTISGKDAFSASVKFEAKNICELLSKCWEHYESKSYLVNFAWIDQIRDVRNKSDITMLDLKLLENINSANFDRIWLVPPEIVDWTDVKGFRYRGMKRGELFDDLSIQDLAARIDKVVILKDDLSGTKVHLISSKTDSASTSWSSYSCIYAEVTLENKFYILNAGKWYEVDQSFVEAISKDFKATAECTVPFPNYDTSHTKEADYNNSLAGALPGSVFLDAKNIMHGGGHSSIEFCDVLSAERHLIHVKRYGGSAQLSHLFSQGMVSGTLFVSDPEFRVKVNAKLPSALKIADTSVRPDATKYEVVFAIISKSEKDLDIPFFSKVTLKNAKTTLSGYGFKVTLKKIASNADDDESVIEDA